VNIIKPGQHVYIIQNDDIHPKKVKDVCTSSGELYLPQHGDDCYVSFSRRRGSDWFKHDRVYHDLCEAQLALAAKLRKYAEACILRAEGFEASVARFNEAKRKAGHA